MHFTAVNLKLMT